MDLLERARKAVRAEGTTRHDEDLLEMIEAAKLDLGIAGVTAASSMDALVEQAILTYCRIHFGREDSDVRDRLQASYDMQKGQLQVATGYTDWGDPS